MNYQELGLVVSNDRRRRRLSQTDYAEAVGISRNYLSMIELGKAQNISVEILVNLAGVMKVSPTYLLSVLLEVAPQSVELVGKREPTEADIEYGLRLAEGTNTTDLPPFLALLPYPKGRRKRSGRGSRDGAIDAGGVERGEDEPDS